MTKAMNYDLNSIMKVMRFAVRRGKSHLNASTLYDAVVKKMNYSTFISRTEDLFTRDVNSMIPWCELERKKESLEAKYGGGEICNLFNPIVTDLGICHSFNPRQTMDMLKPSMFTEAFEEAFKDDLPINPVINGSGSGVENALDFYLMDNSFRRMTDEKPSRFLLGLTTKNNYFDMKSVSQVIKPGFHTIWKVQAIEIFPSDNLRDLPILKRNCRFPDETDDLQIFKVYSKSACEYECRVKKAVATCGCYPWYVPSRPSPTKQTICDVFGNSCFDYVLRQKDTWKGCSCLPTCHHIEYTYSEQTNPLDLDLCETSSISGTIESFLASDMMRNGYNSLTYKIFKVQERLEKESNETLEAWDKSKVRKELCDNMLQNYMAKVSVMFDKKTYIRTRTSLKVTFSDKLAAFGKFSKCSVYFKNQIMI